jgi:hypothetical protein
MNRCLACPQFNLGFRLKMEYHLPGHEKASQKCGAFFTPLAQLSKAFP